MIINAIFIWKLQHSASVKGCHCGPAGQEAVVLEIVRFTLTTHVSDCKKEDAHSLFIIGSLRKDDDTANENIIWKYYYFLLQSNLDYPDSLGLDKIVRIIDSPDNQEYEY